MADTKIASMVEATSINDTDLIVVEDSVDTKKMTKANFKETMGINAKAETSSVGDRQYTENNVVVDGESITDSIDKLDTEIKGMGITSGSNANGSWIKFPDGTMQCWGNVEGSGFGSNYAQVLKSFPQTFLEPPDVIGSMSDTIGGYEGLIYSCVALNNAQYRMYLIKHNKATITSIELFGVTYFATGRWK